MSFTGMYVSQRKLKSEFFIHINKLVNWKEIEAEIQLYYNKGFSVAGRPSYKPLLGWNSWDSYGKFPTKKAMLANLDAMEKKLKPFGYTYFVIDAGWDIEKDASGKITQLAIDELADIFRLNRLFPMEMKSYR